jgi:hypothetical protein
MRPAAPLAGSSSCSVGRQPYDLLPASTVSAVIVEAIASLGDPNHNSRSGAAGGAVGQAQSPFFRTSSER